MIPRNGSLLFVGLFHHDHSVIRRIIIATESPVLPVVVIVVIFAVFEIYCNALFYFVVESNVFSLAVLWCL